MYRLRWILSLLLLTLLVPVVSANGMPVGAWLGTPSGLILPAGGPNVKVQSEELRFVISGSTAVVSALYRLENQGDAATGEVAFAVPSGATGILVTLDGASISVPMNLAPAESLGVVDADSLTRRPTDWLNPITAEPYLPKMWRKEPGVYWQSFRITLKPGPQELLVTYRSAAGEDNSQLIRSIHRYDYLLAPASRWASFGDLTIKIETTEASSLAANLPLTRVDDRHWEARLTQLPDQNLTLFVGPPGSGSLANLWWSQSGRLWLMLSLAVLLGLGAGFMGRGGWLHALAAPVPLLLIDRGIYAPNPFGNVAYLASMLLVPLLFFAWWWLAARFRRGSAQKA